jgi:Mrp family chromosome partitioning ATPase
MSRMLEALKVLDARKRREHEPNCVTPAGPLAGEAAVDDLLAAIDEIDATPPRAAAQPQPVAAFETCLLPTADEPAEHYAEMAARINEQMASNYCNVLLFVGADRWVEPTFSMTHLAQAFARQSAGDVLLVDGDLRRGALSKAVARPGPGMIEAMLGRANWLDIIHPTNAAQIDFAARGNGQVPTVERAEFGWGALRPLYRAVLIGLAVWSEPETTWLAGRCDGVYLVISRPHTRRSAASGAINSLRSCGANVVGSIVVND